MTSDWALSLTFAVAAAVSLGASWVLVSALERVGARLGLSESLLGMLAALAADAPEITSAVTALLHHDQRIGAGVVIGSNVFNLAALIGLSGIVAGSIALHPRVIELAGVVAIWIALCCLATVTALISPLAGLIAVAGVLGPYTLVLGIDRSRLTRLRLPRAWTGWLAAAIAEEEVELEDAIHPRPGGPRQALAAGAAVATVIGASIVMEHTGSRLGRNHGVPPIVIGGLVIAAVTSLPNAVAAVYLASRGRAAAVLSTALNSNAINVLAGLLIPTTILGIGTPSGETTFVAGAYVAMTLLALLLAYSGRGLRRREGIVIIAAYALFTAVLLLVAY